MGEIKNPGIKMYLKKFKEKAKSWKHKTLSFGGWEIMVKSVLKAIGLFIVGSLAFIKIAEWFMKF